jgi:hypothetical protein
MIDDKDIEVAANKHIETEYARYNNGEVEEEMICLRGKDSFKAGAKWMQEEFLKDLWHPMQEEPKLVGEEIIIEEFLEGKRYTMVQNYMVGVEFLDTIETIRWISDWDSFLAEICDDVKMIRWCYFKDLLPKEGGEQ